MNGAAAQGGAAGYVLTGGSSTRMGRNKALLELRGEPLACIVARRIRQAAGSVTLVGDPENYTRLGLRAIADDFPGEGPLGGIVTALRDSTSDWNLVAACDMPALHADWLCMLLDAARRSGCDALLPVDPAGRLQPLCAVYGAGALAGLERAFSTGVRKISAALEHVRAVPFPVPETDCFQNLNTPEEWAAYAAK